MTPAWNCCGETSSTAPMSHSPVLGWVIRYGIAPYSSELWSTDPNPAASSRSLVGKLICQMKTATQKAISATVTTGNREVGLLSFSGSTGRAKSRRHRPGHNAGMRTADPWRDLDVIDERAPRFNQAVVGLVALLGAIFGWPLAWALMGAQLLIGLVLGRRFCLTCVAYFEVVQPRLDEGD